MKRFYRIVSCVLLTFAACSGATVAQELYDTYNEFAQGYHNEFHSTPEQSQKLMELSHYEHNWC